MRGSTVNLDVDDTFGCPLCMNFALDEALGRIEENILLGGTTQRQRKNKTRDGKFM